MFGDVTKSFGKNFLVAHLTPSGLFVILNLLMMATGSFPKPKTEYWKIFGIGEGVAIFGIALLIGLFLGQVNIFVVKAYEGYYKNQIARWASIFLILAVLVSVWSSLLWLILPALLFPIGLFLAILSALQFVQQRFHVAQHKAIMDHIPNSKEPEVLLKKHHFTRNYPPIAKAVLPTKLGNIIRAFEYHPSTLYKMDPITSWPRLLAVLPQPYIEKIEDAQSGFTFLLNFSFLLSVVGLECLGVLTASFLYSRVITPGLLICLIFSMIGSYVFYHAACVSAKMDWGEHVRGAFDLYRLDLMKQFGVYLDPRPITLEEEQKIWRIIQKPIFYLEMPRTGLKFLPRTWEAKEIKSASALPGDPIPSNPPEDDPKLVRSNPQASPPKMRSEESEE